MERSYSSIHFSCGSIGRGDYEDRATCGRSADSCAGAPISASREPIQALNIVNTACGPIEYGEYGKGLPLLMVHRSGGGFDQGLDFARILIPEGYQVIAPSRSSHSTWGGRSSR